MIACEIPSVTSCTRASVLYFKKMSGDKETLDVTVPFSSSEPVHLEPFWQYIRVREIGQPS